MFLQEERRPKVGLAVIIFKDGKVLMGKRKGDHGGGFWAPPGGHIEWKESFEECAARETREEAGIEIQNIKFVHATNDFHRDKDEHYVTVFMIADYDSGDVQNCEQDKCEGWHWKDWDDLPQPLFHPVESFLASGFVFGDDDLTQDQRIAIQKTKAFVKETLKEAESGHDWWHIYRVWKTAKTILKTEKADSFIVQLAALLHDIADSKFHNHDLEIGPRVASEFLESINVDKIVIDHVAQIIKAGSFKGAGADDNMASREGAIVQDADRLDALGAIGIARAFSYGGKKDREMYNSEQSPIMHKNYEEYATRQSHTINHFYEKLLLLKDKMNTETGKRMAQERHVFLETYLEQFYKEWDGGSSNHAYGKLVRDNIPEIIEQNNENPVIHIADEEEYKIRLREKLQEEVDEFLAGEYPEELADILEVMYAFCDLKGIDRNKIEHLRAIKAQRRGGFSKRIVLDDAIK